MINRYSTISEKQFNLYTPPLEQLGAALETAQKTYDRNFLYANELKNKYINALPKDRARANEMQTEWESKVDNLVKTYNGDYSQATKDLYLLQKDIEKQYRQGGEAYAIEYNYNQLQDSMKRNKERLEKKDITQEQYSSLYDYFDKNYNGATKNEDGTWAVANIPELASYVDSSKLADEATKNLKPRIVKRSREYTKNGRIYNEVVEQSVIDPMEVQSAIEGAVWGNDQYTNYVKQLGQLTGLDPNEIINYEVQSNVASFGKTRAGVFNDSQELKSQVDPFAIERMRYQHDLSLEKYKMDNKVKLAAMKGEIQTPDSAPSMRMIANVNNENSRFKPIDINQGIQSPSKMFGQTGIGAALSGSTIGSSLLTARVPFTSSKATVDQVIKNPNQYYNIDVPLLAALKQQNPSYNDTQVMEAYNRSLKRQNYGEGVYIDAYRNSDTGEEAAKLTLPYLQAGSSKALFVDAAGNKRELTKDEKAEYYSKLWDSEKKRPTTASIGTTFTNSGKVPYGEVFPVDNGYLVISSNNEAVSQFNEYIRPKAFDFISENRNAGEPFDIMLSGSPAKVQGVKVPIKKYEGGLPHVEMDIRYVLLNSDGSVKMTRDKYGNLTPDYFTEEDERSPNGFRYSGPYDMERAIGEQLRRIDVPRNIKSKSSESNTTYE